MSQENLSNLSLTQYLSACLRVFRKKLLDAVKISQKEPSHSKVIDNQCSTLHESLRLSGEIDRLQSELLANPVIFNRFVSRLKELLESISLKISKKCELERYIQQLERLCQQATIQNNRDIFQAILIKPIFNLAAPEVYLSKITQIPKKSEQKPESNNYLEGFEREERALNNEFKLLTGLNIDEVNLRKIFFLSRQDHHRKTDTLYEEMIVRNRYISEAYKVYINSFEQNKIKKTQKMRKPPKKKPTPFKTFQKSQLNPFTPIKTLSTKNQKFQMDSPALFNKKLKSQNSSKKDLYSSTSSNINNYKSVSSQLNITSKKQLPFDSKNRIKTTHFGPINTEQEFYSDAEGAKIKRVNLFQLNKVQLGNRIELLPCKAQQKGQLIHYSRSQAEFEAEKKRQFFYRKTHESLKKKFNGRAEIKCYTQGKSEESPKKERGKLEILRFDYGKVFN